MGIHQYPGEGGTLPVAQHMTYQVFAGYHLSDAPPNVPLVTSCPFERVGDTVTLTFAVINSTPGAVLTVELQGSYDGQMWQTLASGTQTGFGYNTITQADVNHTMVRAFAVGSEPGGLPFELRMDLVISTTQTSP